MMYVYHKIAFSFEVVSLLPHMIPDECTLILQTA